MLKGKIAVVTGGTRGIGYAIVKKYLENGAKVILFGSRQETVDKALASLKEENPEWEVSGACPSLTDAKEVADEIQAIHRKYGKIDILVNNAGVSDSMMTIDCNPEHFQEIINLNVNAVFNAIQPSVELMKEQGGGCIINTSSMVSKYGQPGGVAYPTSKFGGKRSDNLSCKRTGTIWNPCQCSCTWNYQNRYGGSTPGGRNSAAHCNDSSWKNRRTGRCGKCMPLSRK